MVSSVYILFLLEKRFFFVLKKSTLMSEMFLLMIHLLLYEKYGKMNRVFNLYIVNEKAGD